MLVIIALIVLGLCFGSFINALVWRLQSQEQGAKKSKELSILKGRSMCPNCRHQLRGKDLVPVLSWLSLGGHCRYCQKPISIQYPLVELISALIFALSYQFWPGGHSAHGNELLLITWLICSVGLLALAVYDWRYLILPSRIIYPTLIVAIAGRLGYILFYATNRPHSLESWALGLLVASGIFWVIFNVSRGKWIGYGDVRLGLITGTLLASPAKAFLMIFLASLAGSLYASPAYIKNPKMTNTKLPYGPFLIGATFVATLWGNSFIDSYKNLLK